MISSSLSVISVQIQSKDFDPAVELQRLSSGRSDSGAIVSFLGLCRDEGGSLAALELEHYPGMAEMQIRRIVDNAVSRWSLHAVSVIHRYGLIAPGENIVWVGVASSHRKDAFEATEFIMDYLKTSAPFWKREHLKNSGAGEWVSAKEDDDDALKRWNI